MATWISSESHLINIGIYCFGYYNIFLIIFHFTFFPEGASHGKTFTSCKDLGAFFDGISGAAITMKYNQMNAD
ncbi:MAG: hypothetical protein KGJ87_08270 [Planctomycetota bacterium]|nr:hypothetical protein [Planctomycetota bacterium]